MEARVLSSHLPEIRDKLRSCISGDVLSYSFTISAQPCALGVGCPVLDRMIVDPYLDLRGLLKHRGESLASCFNQYRRVDGILLAETGIRLRLGNVVDGDVKIVVKGMTCCKHRASKLAFVIE
jgi:hypothetical protein